MARNGRKTNIQTSSKFWATGSTYLPDESAVTFIKSLILKDQYSIT